MIWCFVSGRARAPREPTLGGGVGWAELSTGVSVPATAGMQAQHGHGDIWDMRMAEGPSMDTNKKVDLKIIIIGALGVGKTSLLHQYVHKTFYEDYRTTLGASILTKVLAVDNTSLKLQIWDTGGQERFRSMVSTFYKGSDGCMLAFDVTDRESFESLDNWRNDFLDKVIPREQDFPMVVLGNKIDICDRQVPKETASAWCKEKDIPYFEHTGIFESYLTDSIKLTPQDKPKKKCC
ncbi:ras-related protein Rab-7b isoform X3 [Heliangelus exortis]|uniref:ras-related protein Rab-7b isoform X3 n=1 Tax=Heliangelus exortis TaxID=472823 RepID=UPI003A905210